MAMQNDKQPNQTDHAEKLEPGRNVDMRFNSEMADADDLEALKRAAEADARAQEYDADAAGAGDHG